MAADFAGAFRAAVFALDLAVFLAAGFALFGAAAFLAAVFRAAGFAVALAACLAAGFALFGAALFRAASSSSTALSLASNGANAFLSFEHSFLSAFLNFLVLPMDTPITENCCDE